MHCAGNRIELDMRLCGTSKRFTAHGLGDAGSFSGENLSLLGCEGCDGCSSDTGMGKCTCKGPEHKYLGVMGRQERQGIQLHNWRKGLNHPGGSQ